MICRGVRWLIYDVFVKQVGRVNNYRAQFNQIIQASSYEELVRKMKNLALANVFVPRWKLPNHEGRDQTIQVAADSPPGRAEPGRDPGGAGSRQ